MLLYGFRSHGWLHDPCDCKVRTSVKPALAVSGLSSQVETRGASVAQSSSNTPCKPLLVLFLALPHTSSASAGYILTSLLSSFQTPLPPKPVLTSNWAHAILWQAAKLIWLSNSLCDGCVCLSGSSDELTGILWSPVPSWCPMNIRLPELWRHCRV